MVRIRIAVDNTSADARLGHEHGFACVVDAHDKRVLFDTGATPELLLRNLEILDVAPSSVDLVFISHPHWDHVGGLAGFLERARPPVVLPASAPPPPEAERVVSVDRPIRLAPGLWSTGQMPAVDYPLQEQSLVVETGAGSVVVVGCSHPGVGRILDAAVRCVPGRVRALVGGLHGFDDVRKLADIDLVVPAHCTRHGDAIEAAWPDRVLRAGAGRVVEVP